MDTAITDIVDNMMVTNDVTKNDDRTTVKDTSDIVANAKRFSLLAAIYNWQPTGTTIRINTPVLNGDNVPLFLCRISPIWIPSTHVNNICADSRTNLPGYIWTRTRNVFYPYIVTYKDYELVKTGSAYPSALSILETDNMPDITLYTLHHMAWTGSIEIMMKIISNVTTQGMFSISRLYSIQMPNIFTPDAEKNGPPVLMNSRSALHRRMNAYVTQDLARTQDLILKCPYRSLYPFENIKDRFDGITHVKSVTGGYVPNDSVNPIDSYLAFDILSQLYKSASAGEVLIEIWIRAGPDFKLFGPNNPMSFVYDTRPTYVNPDDKAFVMPQIYGGSSDTTITVPNLATLNLKLETA